MALQTQADGLKAELTGTIILMVKVDGRLYCGRQLMLKAELTGTIFAF